MFIRSVREWSKSLLILLKIEYGKNKKCITDVTISISVEQEDFSSPAYGLYEIYSATQIMMIPVNM